MTNHYHLVIETPDGNLSKGMRQLNGVYTQASNRKHGRIGHLFQGLPRHLKKFGLQVAPEKTRILRFSRFHPGLPRRFAFLGFELYGAWTGEVSCGS